MDMLQDRLAFDRAMVDSARTIDRDGHLHVSDVPISKATVNGYRGSEIPNWQKLGLDADRTYQLLRDPEELAKAASTFNGKTLMDLHPAAAENARDHNHAGTVGTVHNVRFEDPYLIAGDFHVWDGVNIGGIATDEQREVSAAYHYVPDMTPGRFKGVAYDGVMRDIACNHVALVPKGRAGPDVVVCDAASPDVPSPPPSKETPAMATSAVALSRPAAVVAGALYAHARPLLATDAKPDFAAMARDVTAKGFGAQKQAIVARYKAGLVGKLANDAADLGDVADVLEAVQAVVEAMPDDVVAGAADPTDPAEDDGMEAKLRAAGLTDDEIAKVMAAMGPSDPAPAAMDDKPDGKKDDKPAMDTVSKPAMDAAIREAVKLATRSAEAQTIARLNGIRAAEDLVRPIIGAVIAQDSAEAVLKLALDHAGVDLTGVPKDVGTYTALVRMIPRAEDRPTVSRTTVAMDAAASDEYTAMFGANASRLLRA